MADVRPFRGLRYNSKKHVDLENLIAPPYDVVDPELQKQLYEKSNYNIIQLELGTAKDTDTPDNNRYTRAATLLTGWLNQQVLTSDTEPSFYLTSHAFQYQGKRLERKELTVALRLEEWSQGMIRPHEGTAAGPKEDRLALMQSTKTNLSPIMLLSDDPTGLIQENITTIEKEPPLAVAEVDNDTTFKVWKQVEGELTSSIQQSFKDLPLYIADGHHRYETALEYCRRNQVPLGGDTNESAAFVLASIIDISDSGLLSLPYHRLIRNLTSNARRNLTSVVSKPFTIESYQVENKTSSEIADLFDQIRRNANAPVFGIYGLQTNVLSILLVSDIDAIQEVMPAGRSRAWCTLTPTIFSEYIAPNFLDMTQPEAESSGILDYTGDAHAAIASVKNGASDAAFLSSSVPFDALKQVADAGERLPRKSTYFYPKLTTGIVMKSLIGTL